MWHTLSVEENPFRPGGELCREAEDVLRHSIISRSKVVISDPVVAAFTSESVAVPTHQVMVREDTNGGVRSHRQGKHSVHFSTDNPLVVEDHSTVASAIDGGDVVVVDADRLDHRNSYPTVFGDEESPCPANGGPQVHVVKLNNGGPELDEAWYVMSEATVQTVAEAMPLQAEHVTLKKERRFRRCCELL